MTVPNRFALHLDALRRPRQQMTTSPVAGSSLSGASPGPSSRAGRCNDPADRSHATPTAQPISPDSASSMTDVLDRYSGRSSWKNCGDGLPPHRRPCRLLAPSVAGVLRRSFSPHAADGHALQSTLRRELMDRAMRPLSQSRLYQQTRAESIADAPSMRPAVLSRHSTADDWSAICSRSSSPDSSERHNLPIPDHAEATFLLAWATAWPAEAWLATVNARPVGFIMVQPDLIRSHPPRQWRAQSSLARMVELAARRPAEARQAMYSTAAWLSTGGERHRSATLATCASSIGHERAGDNSPPDLSPTVAMLQPFSCKWAQNAGSTTQHTSWIFDSRSNHW